MNSTGRFVFFSEIHLNSRITQPREEVTRKNPAPGTLASVQVNFGSETVGKKTQMTRRGFVDFRRLDGISTQILDVRERVKNIELEGSFSTM